MSPITIAAYLVAAAISIPFLGLLVCAAAPLVEAAAYPAQWKGQ